MLGCIYQLWDWLEAPPLFTAANMDAKKLHQLQQSQNVQKKLPLAYQTNIADYRTATHSPVFQQQQQLNYHMSHVPSGSSNTAALTAQYQQSPTTTSSSGPLSPIDIQPQANKLLLKHQVTSGSGGNTSSSAHSSPYHQPSTSSGYPTSSGGTAGNSEQLYQSPTERTYLAAAGRLQASHNPATTLQQQYQQLQQAKLQAQLQTQNEAIQHQHRTFALRQAMNPPVPQGHYHASQSSSMVSSVPQQSVVQQQMASQQQQRAPPSSLTLSNQFQPASGPLKVNQQQQAQHSVIGPQGQQHFHHHPQQQVHRSQEQIYGQHQHQQLQMQLHHQQQLHQQQQHQQQHYHPLQQRSKSDLQTPSGGNDQSPVYIQQNHPGHVVNQACQTQISAVVKTSQTTQNTKTPSSEDSSSASAKSPTHHPVDRKKSSGGSNSSNTQALKSPLTKRPPSSPVTISGWLYKQGSDGLKVWRKRWFVLAEYCLYYYKGPEEEKLLGSILLPSYKVSACLPEDKIYRKYAFKCEHQNMRTYWLAAENPESMVQWVRALSAAAMMQASASGGESSEQPSVSSSSANQSGENSDSGIHTLQSQQSKLSSQGQVTPASDSGKNQATNGNSGGGGGVQPLYANAPPKPRRITDGGYSSPSPEHSIDNERRAHQQQQQQQHQHQHQFQPSATSRRSGIMSPTLQQMQQQQQQQQYAHTHSGQSRPQHHAIYDTRTGNVSSALRVQQPPTQQYQQQQQSVYNIDHLETQYQQQMSLMNDENSKTSPGSYMDAQMEAQIMQLQQQRAAIGDDIYGERELYMQRLIQQRYPAQAPNYGTNNAERRTPDAYGRSKNRIFSDYEDIYNFTQPGNVGATNVMSAQEALIQEAASYRRPLSPPTYDGHKHVPSIPSLYATNHLEHSSTQNVIGSNSNLRARPAAAIIRPHSADFLEYEARNDIATTDALPTPATTSHLTHMVKPDPVRAPRPKSSLDINRTADSFYYSEENYAEKMRKSALYLQHPQGQTTLAQPQQAGSYRTATGSSDFLAAPHNGLNTIGYENPYERAYKRNELMQDALINQTGHTSIPRMSRSQMIGAGSHVRSSSTHPHTPQSPTIQQSNLLTAGLTTQQIIQQNEQFLRSASARLPKRTGTFDDEPNSPPPPADASPPPVVGTNNNAPASHLDGERKREESMKRLLEWKQRMLQSPLTRKGAQAHSTALNSNNDNSNGKNNVTNASKLGSNPNILLSSTTVASGAHYPIKKTNSNANNVNVGLQRSRSETHANSGHGTGYNSYSSDDEASISIRNVRNLPRSNLTVKPDATDAQLQHHQQHQQQQLQQPQQQYNNYDQMQKLTNTYYGTAHDTKYAKATTLTDRNARSIGGNSSSRGVGGVGVGGGGGGGGGDGKNGGGSGIALTNGIYATASTPLHPSNDGLDMGEYFVSGVGGNGSNHNIYGMHNGYQSIAATQQHQHLSHSLRRAGSRAEIDMLERETSTQIRNLEVSAGDLLSRTHEELVLLLIQLRRQNSNTARNIEQCCSDIHDVQNRLRGADGLSRAESIQRLDYLKQHLLDLERQYEKSKPLVNLVDNMVKLGSLYRNDAQQQRTQQTNQRTEAAALDRLEFNHRIQERRMLQEEQKQWNRLSPNHTELQSKVHQLYQLDQLLQEESGTLQNLQRDKEDLERALGGLRARIQDTNGPPLALEAAKKQQHMLERELSRVHQLLADNSKVAEKLEQTVAGNARLEQELLILRQKLQSTRGSQTALAISDTYASNTTAMLESELKRVQTLVGDMQRQRQELSSAVRQLTENSNRLYQEIGNKEQDGLRVNESSSNNGSIKKRGNTGCWIETDLDSMISVNRTLSDSTMNLSQPLYVDTSTVGTSKLSDFSGSEDVINEATRRSHNSNSSHLYRYNDLSDNLETSGVDSDGFLDTNPFANLTNQEKQEIKTVRIVKRESERRHRDRNERTSLTSSIQNLDQVLEEEHYGHMNGALGGINVGLNSNDDSSQHQSIERSKSLPRAYNNETTVIKSSKHHHHHQHRHKHNNSIYNDYNYGPGQNNQSYDKNSNYSHNRNGQQQALTNGHIVPPREHLNPLANAYFAKQLQEKQKQQQQQQQHSQPYTSYARENFHSELRRKTESVQSLNKSLTDLTPFQSEAAKQILSEMSGSASEDTEKVVEKIPSQHKHRRAVPREKRRHYTAPNNVINVKGLETTQTENDMNRNNTNWRARDDLDMEVALRPRLNAPDVVRSALGRGEKISENTIDNLLLAPNKIVIPERYIPENTPELSPEEKKRRQEKVESIKKMLADAPISTANETTATLPPSKLNEEKKQREHLLQLNQILAQQVMQMSKIVAEKAMSKIGNGEQNGVKETDDGRKSVSPNEPLPIYQQRDNYFS
ncbi:pleckstrin homology domain-containing family A member kramer isoform 3-T16 [Glossina fuscipes fuscipes]